MNYKKISLDYMVNNNGEYDWRENLNAILTSKYVSILLQTFDIKNIIREQTWQTNLTFKSFALKLLVLLCNKCLFIKFRYFMHICCTLFPYNHANVLYYNSSNLINEKNQSKLILS